MVQHNYQSTEIRNVDAKPTQAADWEFAAITRTRHSPGTLQSPPCCLHLLLSTEYSGDNLGWGDF